MSKFDEALPALLDEFCKFDEILIVYLYGSVARGDYSVRHSDMDLFIILRKSGKHLKEKITRHLVAAAGKFGVDLHIEYQSIFVREQDRSLLQKVVEEGKVVYASGVLPILGKTIGLRRYKLIEYSTSELDQKKRSRLSQILNGRKVGSRIYKGVVDNNEVISCGKGALLVLTGRLKSLERVFEKQGVRMKTKRLVFA